MFMISCRLFFCHHKIYINVEFINHKRFAICLFNNFVMSVSFFFSFWKIFEFAAVFFCFLVLLLEKLIPSLSDLCVSVYASWRTFTRMFLNRDAFLVWIFSFVYDSFLCYFVCWAWNCVFLLVGMWYVKNST